ncbi:MAG: DoxX family protein, partial [bacterium]
AAGLAILVGWRTRWAVLALIVYLVPITWYTHVAVAQAAVDQVVKDQEFFQALKNLAVIGGLLLLRSSGPGRHSLDGN